MALNGGYGSGASDTRGTVCISSMPKQPEHERQLRDILRRLSDGESFTHVDEYHSLLTNVRDELKHLLEKEQNKSQGLSSLKAAAMMKIKSKSTPLSFHAKKNKKQSIMQKTSSLPLPQAEAQGLPADKFEEMPVVTVDGEPVKPSGWPHEKHVYNYDRIYDQSETTRKHMQSTMDKIKSLGWESVKHFVKEIPPEPPKKDKEKKDEAEKKPKKEKKKKKRKTIKPEKSDTDAEEKKDADGETLVADPDADPDAEINASKEDSKERKNSKEPEESEGAMDDEKGRKGARKSSVTFGSTLTQEIEANPKAKTAFGKVESVHEF